MRPDDDRTYLIQLLNSTEPALIGVKYKQSTRVAEVYMVLPLKFSGDLVIADVRPSKLYLVKSFNVVMKLMVIP